MCWWIDCRMMDGQSDIGPSRSLVADPSRSQFFPSTEPSCLWFATDLHVMSRAYMA
jgi:hypothetical protein